MGFTAMKTAVKEFTNVWQYAPLGHPRRSAAEIRADIRARCGTPMKEHDDRWREQPLGAMSPNQLAILWEESVIADERYSEFMRSKAEESNATEPKVEIMSSIPERLAAAGVPERFRQGFVAFEPRPGLERLRDAAVRYAEEFVPGQGVGLMFSGATGAGKSLLAACIARRLCERSFRVRWWNMADMFAAIKETWHKDAERGAELDFVEHVLAADCLFLDDLGVEKPTAWTLEKLYQIVNRAYERRIPVIVTLNLKSAELQAQWGAKDQACRGMADRLMSRLLGMVKKEVEFPKVDQRQVA